MKISDNEYFVNYNSNYMSKNNPPSYNIMPTLSSYSYCHYYVHNYLGSYIIAN